MHVNVSRRSGLNIMWKRSILCYSLNIQQTNPVFISWGLCQGFFSCRVTVISTVIVQGYHFSITIERGWHQRCDSSLSLTITRLVLHTVLHGLKNKIYFSVGFSLNLLVEPKNILTNGSYKNILGLCTQYCTNICHNRHIYTWYSWFKIFFTVELWLRYLNRCIVQK